MEQHFISIIGYYDISTIFEKKMRKTVLQHDK